MIAFDPLLPWWAIALIGIGLFASAVIAQHAGRQTAEIYAPPDRLAEARAEAEAAGLRVRPAGPAIAIVGSERANGEGIPADAVVRAASLEDVFVLLTGEEAE